MLGWRVAVWRRQVLVVPCAVQHEVVHRRHGTSFSQTKTRSRISTAPLRAAVRPGRHWRVSSERVDFSGRELRIKARSANLPTSARPRASGDPAFTSPAAAFEKLDSRLRGNERMGKWLPPARAPQAYRGFSAGLIAERHAHDPPRPPRADRSHCPCGDRRARHPRPRPYPRPRIASPRADRAG